MTLPANTPAVWKIVCKPIARWDDPTGIRRMRSLLKAMLRSYGVRVLRFEEPTAEDVAGEVCKSDLQSKGGAK